MGKTLVLSGVSTPPSSLKGVPIESKGFTITNNQLTITDLEGFILTISVNPNLVPVVSFIRAWKSLGVPDDQIVSRLNNSKELTKVVKDTLARGTAESNSISKLEMLSQNIFERVIDAIKKSSADYCQSLVKKLANSFKSNQWVGPILAHLSGKAAEVICGLLIELLDELVFRRYVVPFINDLLNFDLISENVGGFKPYGSSPAERAEIAAALDSMKKINQEFKNLITAGAFKPPQDVLDSLEDFSTETTDGTTQPSLDNEKKDNNTTIILALSIVSAAGIVYSIKSKQ